MLTLQVVIEYRLQESEFIITMYADGLVHHSTEPSASRLITENLAMILPTFTCYQWCLVTLMDLMMIFKMLDWDLQISWGTLTHRGRVRHICVSKLTTIGSDNGLSPGRCQAIIWTNAGIMWTGPLGTNFNEILIKIYAFSFKKMHLKRSSGKWRPFCRGLNVLKVKWGWLMSISDCPLIQSCNIVASEVSLLGVHELSFGINGRRLGQEDYTLVVGIWTRVLYKSSR